MDNPSADQAPSQPARRPVAITVICIIGFIGALFAIPILLSGAASSIGSWYPPFLAISTVAGFASMVGMWLMRKWGVYLYAALTVIGQVVVIAMGLWTVISLVIPAIVAGIGFANLSK